MGEGGNANDFIEEMEAINEEEEETLGGGTAIPL